MSTLDKAVIVGMSTLAIDGIIVPFFTGKTAHEYLGLPPPGDLKILGERTALQAEQAVWGLTILYSIVKGFYD